MILFEKTEYTNGFMNLILGVFGVSPIDFIDGPYWAKMFVLCFYTVWVVLPFKILILTSALASVNQDYYKAAKVDGCSDLEFITKILIPLSKPALFTTGILSFISGWNSFLWPILVTNSKEMRLLSNGLSSFATESGTSVQLQMAASTITIIPILIVYFIFRKQIIRGVVKSGVKG